MSPPVKVEMREKGGEGGGGGGRSGGGGSRGEEEVKVNSSVSSVLCSLHRHFL